MPKTYSVTAIEVATNRMLEAEAEGAYAAAAYWAVVRDRTIHAQQRRLEANARRRERRGSARPDGRKGQTPRT